MKLEEMRIGWGKIMEAMIGEKNFEKKVLKICIMLMVTKLTGVWLVDWTIFG